MTENLAKLLAEVSKSQVDNPVDSEEVLAIVVDGIVDALLEDWPKERAREEARLTGFRERLTLVWNRPLTLFRILLAASGECFEEYAASLEQARTAKGASLRQALYYVYGRVLRTATAVGVLLEQGLPDDAYARCRTLYELYVTGSFIADHGDEAGLLYLEHDAVGQWKRLKRETSWGAKNVPKRLERTIEADYRRVLRLYGESFGNDYGWASKFLLNKSGKAIANPKVEQIARATLVGELPDGHPPFYVESSFQVHAGVTGALGLASGGQPIFPVGRGNAGLEVPLMSASQWIARASALLRDHSLSMERGLKNLSTDTLLRLEERIREEATVCAEQVERETARLKKLRGTKLRRKK